MDILKCNLYIVGSPGIGKTFLIKILEEFIHAGRQSTRDIYKGTDWIIRTENTSIEVEFKESRISDMALYKSSGKEIKTIVLYIADSHQVKSTFTIRPKHVDQLNKLSNNATIIVVSALRSNDFDRKISISL